MVILASYLNTEHRIILTICQDFTPHTDLEFRDSYLSVDDNRENAILVMNLLGLIFLFLNQLSGNLKDSIQWITHLEIKFNRSTNSGQIFISLKFDSKHT